MPSQPQITVRNRTTGEKKAYRLDQERATIGREPSNYIVLDDRAVSRKHAEILQENNQYFVRDLKSNNGTQLNDKPLASHEKALLRAGDLIVINDFEVSFNLPTAKESEDIYEITDTDVLEVKMVKKLLQAMDRENAPSLEVIEGPQTGIRFVFEEKNQDVVIGRDPACEFVIDSTVMSRKHARIEKRFDTVILHDLHSKNGTFVNREKIESKRLQDGDIVHLGTLSLSFRNPQELSFDFGPPEISQIKRSQKASTPSPAPQTAAEDSYDDVSESSASESAGPAGTRGSRRRGGASRKGKSKKTAADAPPPPAEVPQESYEPPLPQDGQMESPSEMDAQDGGGRFSLSPTEIGAIVVGLIVLVGSIWGILKLL